MTPSLVQKMMIKMIEQDGGINLSPTQQQQHEQQQRISSSDQYPEIESHMAFSEMHSATLANEATTSQVKLATDTIFDENDNLCDNIAEETPPLFLMDEEKIIQNPEEFEVTFMNRFDRCKSWDVPVMAEFSKVLEDFLASQEDDVDKLNVDVGYDEADKIAIHSLELEQFVAEIQNYDIEQDIGSASHPDAAGSSSILTSLEYTATADQHIHGSFKSQYDTAGGRMHSIEGIGAGQNINSKSPPLQRSSSLQQTLEPIRGQKIRQKSDSEDILSAHAAVAADGAGGDGLLLHEESGVFASVEAAADIMHLTKSTQGKPLLPVDKNNGDTTPFVSLLIQNQIVTPSQRPPLLQAHWPSLYPTSKHTLSIKTTPHSHLSSLSKATVNPIVAAAPFRQSHLQLSNPSRQLAELQRYSLLKSKVTHPVPQPTTIIASGHYPKSSKPLQQYLTQTGFSSQPFLNDAHSMNGYSYPDIISKPSTATNNNNNHHFPIINFGNQFNEQQQYRQSSTPSAIEIRSPSSSTIMHQRQFARSNPTIFSTRERTKSGVSSIGGSSITSSLPSKFSSSLLSTKVELGSLGPDKDNEEYIQKVHEVLKGW